VAVSLVDFRSGFRADVAAIREAAPDALLVVDAIQGLGALAAPLAPADVLVAAGHKWMRAGWGSGVFAVSDRALDRLVPTLTGWWGVEEPFDFDTPPPHEERTDAERLHGGSPAVLGALAFAAAIEVIEIAGIAAIEEAVLDHASRVEEVLRDAGAAILDPWRSPQERSGIVSFSLPGEDPEATHARLGAAGIACTRYGSIIRLAVHASTDAAGFDLLAEAL
jgi:selenocysteine lyase/cysteine desulfurase